jgi:hypothetical protein
LCRQGPKGLIKHLCRQGPKGLIKHLCRQGPKGLIKHLCRQGPKRLIKRLCRQDHNGHYQSGIKKEAIFLDSLQFKSSHCKVEWKTN